MTVSRRRFVHAAAAGAWTTAQSIAAPGKPGLRIGVMDTSLRLAGKTEAIRTARRLGFEGVQVSIGRQTSDGMLRLASAELQAQYLSEAEKEKLPLVSTYLDILHVNCLKDDPLARKWVRHGIEITRKLNAHILMIVFFGKCSLNDQQEIYSTADALKELAPFAKDAGVVLGFENTLSAADNARVLDRVASDALKVYYDVGNSTNIGGFDVPAEIRWLGKDRICQFHLKDKGYMGEGKVDFSPVMHAIGDIGFQGFGNLETSAPSGSVEEDLRRNLSYVRRVIESAAKS